MNARDLLPGERVLASSARHWIVLVRPVTLAVLAMAVAFAVLLFVQLAGELKLFLTLAVALIGLGLINLYYWGWRAHEYVLTDQRVILNEGILSKFSRSIAIDRIQDLTTFQGLWGRALRFGDIELESAGRESAEVLSTVPNPQQLRNAIFAQMEARRRPS
ncbi:MAG TPA: PH domain-containing protein [Candidatus Dormibacteraeota bacterium]|nr:PH domain-containing protein [Candidatus Dormibacteraeota bacterium]